MQIHGQVAARAWVKSRTGIWLALAAALILHAIFVFLPLPGQSPVTELPPALLEVQFSAFKPELPAPVITEPETETRPPPAPAGPPERVAEINPAATLIPQARVQESEPAHEPEYSRLAPSILAAPFLAEESGVDMLFGNPLARPDSKQQETFFFPARQDMISMLNTPMPDLPFDYQAGLIRFAYEPGVRGDLQRFWDVITPEFSWRTNNGTEIKCIWLLVIGGCGWK